MVVIGVFNILQLYFTLIQSYFRVLFFGGSYTTSLFICMCCRNILVFRIHVFMKGNMYRSVGVSAP